MPTDAQSRASGPPDGPAPPTDGAGRHLSTRPDVPLHGSQLSRARPQQSVPYIDGLVDFLILHNSPELISNPSIYPPQDSLLCEGCD